jgi:ABC-2 type transport system permease protein
MMRFIRSAFVIARRDFSATVLSKTFIFFLLAPLFPLLMGGVFGGIGARVANQAEKPVVAVIGPRAEYDRLAAARAQMADALGEDALAKLVYYAPEANLVSQQSRLLASRSPPVCAVLSGGLDHPRVTGAFGNDPATVDQLRLLIADARSGNVRLPPNLAVDDIPASSGSQAAERVSTAWIAQMALFLVTLMLSTMVLSQLIEEKSNKIIEVIAAAMRIDAMFVGKLFAMLAASIFALVVWISAGALLIQMMRQGGIAAVPVPAVGWPVFLVLAITYFAMSYLLFGAAFLMIGAQASTAREVQTMSLPVTFAQVLIFAFAARGIGQPHSQDALMAAIFPLSSPMAMVARAAEVPDLWPHFVAIAWQVFWVALILRVGSQLFRKTVLKSGPRTKWWQFKRA